MQTPQAGAYTPQTEAISPTLPETSTQEDAQFRSTKDDLLQQIAKVDREIAKRESQISKLRKKLKQLENSTHEPIDNDGLQRPADEIPAVPICQSLAQKIYAENRVRLESTIIENNLKFFVLYQRVCVYRIDVNAYYDLLLGKGRRSASLVGQFRSESRIATLQSAVRYENLS